MDPRTSPPPTTSHAPPDIRLRDPAGAVAAVPYLLGFTPQRSLVVIGIDDDRSVGASLRCDYEPGCPPGRTPALWDHLQRVLLRNGCRTSLLLVYTAQDPDDLPPGCLDDLLDAVRPGREAAEDLGGEDPGEDPDGEGPDGQDPEDDDPGAARRERLGVLDVLVVGPSRFRSVLCRDPACCPPQGLPVTEADHHPVAVGFVLAGRSPAADRAAVAPEGSATEAERARASAAVGVAAPTFLPAGVPDGVARGLLDRWVGSLPEGPDPELAGTLAAAWRASTALRDACLAVLLPGGSPHRGLAPRLAPSDRPPSPARPGPAEARLAEALSDPGCARATQVGSPVLRRMAALTSGPERATVLAAHAWLCWVAGEGTAAGVLAERALRTDQDLSLAALVLQCLDHGLGAPWTASRRGGAPRRVSGRPPGRRR